MQADNCGSTLGLGALRPPLPRGEWEGVGKPQRTGCLQWAVQAVNKGRDGAPERRVSTSLEEPKCWVCVKMQTGQGGPGTEARMLCKGLSPGSRGLALGWGGSRRSGWEAQS